MQTPLIERAIQVALDAHKNQVRKSDGSPYVVHPLMCAMMLKEHGFADEVVAAALTHDVLEDTDVTEVALRELLGDAVTDIVKGVSENKALEWEERKEAYVEVVRAGSEGVKAVSIADKIHNMQSLLAAYEDQGSALWEKFNRGKEKKLWFEELCVAMFKDSWQHPLVDTYEQLVARMRTLD